ncbi:MAG TPA: ATP-binding protein [Streptosporangiaceae bacterium]|nr:ATP-binding protein [Streptosporangiaceae bacterium]
MRQVLGDTLSRLGVDENSVSDLLLAVTEACTNVLRHAGPGRRYEVVAQVGRNRCVLKVVDNGRGMDLRRLRSRRGQVRRPPVRPVPLLLRRSKASTDIAQLPESGRGMAIMRACVDDVSLRSGPGQGTVVRLRKRIGWRDDAPLAVHGSGTLREAG